MEGGTLGGGASRLTVGISGQNMKSRDPYTKRKGTMLGVKKQPKS